MALSFADAVCVELRDCRVYTARVAHQPSYQVQSLGTEGRADVSTPEEHAGIQSAAPAAAAMADAVGDASQPDEPVSCLSKRRNL